MARWSLYRVGLLLYWTATASGFSGGFCRFPGSFLGKWFQADKGSVSIGVNTFNDEGRCYHSDERGTYFMAKPSESDGKTCYTCLVITARHDNLLQYKTSRPVCYSAGRNVSSCDIPGDAILHTMVKENATPVPCPFHGAYTFEYDNSTGSGMCVGESKVSPCAGNYRLKFRFKSCSGEPDQAVDFQCLATWRDQDHFVYAKFSRPGYNSQQKAYRCMKFRRVGRDRIEIGSSADSTCLGLRNIGGAPLYMDLRKDPNYPQPGCQFPSWIRLTQWQDLSGAYMFEVDKTHSFLKISEPGSIQNPTITSISCSQEVTPLRTSLNGSMDAFPVFEAISHTLEKCSSNSASFQCVRFIPRSQDVIQIQRGATVRHESHACRPENFRNAPKRTLLSISASKKSCPYPGSHPLLESSLPRRCRDVVQGILDSGCDKKTQITIRTCNKHLDENLQCLGEWIENGVQYIVAKKASASGRLLNCFSFKEKNGIVDFAINNECNFGARSFMRQTATFSFHKPPPKKDVCRSRKSESGQYNTVEPAQNDDVKNTHHNQSKTQPQNNANAGSRTRHLAHYLPFVFFLAAVVI